MGDSLFNTDWPAAHAGAGERSRGRDYCIYPSAEPRHRSCSALLAFASEARTKPVAAVCGSSRVPWSGLRATQCGKRSRASAVQAKSLQDEERFAEARESKDGADRDDPPTRAAQARDIAPVNGLRALLGLTNAPTVSSDCHNPENRTTCSTMSRSWRSD